MPITFGIETKKIKMFLNEETKCVQKKERKKTQIVQNQIHHSPYTYLSVCVCVYIKWHDENENENNDSFTIG